MKVVQINSVCGIGSTGRIVKSISEIATEKGIGNHIFYGSGKCDYALATCIENNWYLKLSILKTRLFGKHGFYSQIATRKLLKRLDEINPDIIHLHNIHGHYINVKMLFRYIKQHDIKTIWTLHDCWAFTGHCAHYDYAECEKWKNGCYKCSQKHTYPVSLLFDRSKSSYKDKKSLFTKVKDMIIITPSEWLADEVKKSFLKDYSIKVINNGINLGNFNITKTDLKSKLGLTGKKIILGICSNLYDMKGGKYLVELSKFLKDDEHMVILGLSTNETLSEKITVLPKTNNVKQLAEIYSMADVFANTTLQDTFPTVNIESLACGTPVVTFDSGGSAEIIDENTGYKVSKGDVTAMYEKIEIIFSEDCKINSDNCRKRAEERYCEKERFNEYIKLYKNYQINPKRGKHGSKESSIYF